jgi:hypothetical protein
MNVTVIPDLAKKALKKITGLFRALIISIPLWLILGIILGIIWK